MRLEGQVVLWMVMFGKGCPNYSINGIEGQQYSNIQSTQIINWKIKGHGILLIMKKIFLTLLLVALVASTCASCGSSGCTGSSCSSCHCPDPTFPVNQPICVKTPDTISPPQCLIPNIECPEVCPPPNRPPTICKPEIDVPEICPPPVVEPPKICPPTVVIPEIKPCPYTPPPPPVLPPCVGNVCVLPPPVIPPPPPPKFCDDKLSNKFVLRFRYACAIPASRPYSCTGNILWNDVIIRTIVPANDNIHNVTIVVEVKGGENKLQFEGTGFSSSNGLTIDQVSLVRDGTNTDIIVNGDFNQPNVGTGKTFSNNIPGWQGRNIEVGWGDLYNYRWNSQVCQLDAKRNIQITQRWNFDSDYKLVQQVACDTNNFIGKSLTFKLELFYARRNKPFTTFSTAYANVLWNNVVVGTLSPSSSVRKFVVFVQLKAGENTLQLDGGSTSDGRGITVDKVSLTSPYINQNLIKNGGFESPSVNGITYFNGGIPHWKADKAEVGRCRIDYNNDWAFSNGQCIDLDSTRNQRYTQIILVSQMKFNQMLVNKAVNEGTQAVQNHINEATNNANQHANQVVQSISDSIKNQIGITRQDFSDYLCDLYRVVAQDVKDLREDGQLAIVNYNCLAQSYIGKFGHSHEIDYDAKCFDHANLENWEGYIEAIHGKIIRCRDVHGHHHNIQIAPCTRFDGQFALPVIGNKIFWKGAKQPCGKTYVKFVTTCNC